MVRRDYHMHTVYCDGAATAEEMVLAAINAGLEEIGFSGHSHTAFDESYCMSAETTERYRQELLLLREKYRDKISIKIGLEMDHYSDADTGPFDYTIGSTHYIRIPAPKGRELCEGCFVWPAEGEGRTSGGTDDDLFVYIPVDETDRLLRQAAEVYFEGDMMALAEKYFENMQTLAGATGCDIIGHFDLISKFNEDGALFDDSDPRYVSAWKKAVDALLPYNIPFEINTGAISKGYRTEAYPARPIREYIRQGGGSFILSSDSHRADTLCYGFDRYESEL